MHVSEIGTHPRRSPGSLAPTAEALITSGISAQIGVIHLEIPAGTNMPEHEHGASEVVLIPLTGSIEVCQGEHRRPLSFGMAAYINSGERVGLANPGTKPATLMVIASPPDFADRVAASWREATATAEV